MKILELLSDNRKSISFLKSFSIRLTEYSQFNKHSKITIFRNKIILILRTLLLPIYCKIHKNKISVFACEPFKHSTEVINQRKNQISKVENEKITFLNGFTIYLCYKDLPRFLLLWVRAIIISLINIPNFKKDFSSQIFPFITFSLNQSLNPESEFYFFRYYSISSYLSAFNTSGKNYIITNEGFLFKRRYTYLPNTTIIYNSKHQRYELDTYIKQYKTLCNKIIDGSLSTINHEIIKSDTKYKIGVYSSGWWARENGLKRTSQINKLKSNPDTFKNEMSIMFESLINLIQSRTEEKFAIYLHPFEQELIKKHDIYPPYLRNLVESKYDIISFEDNSKRFMNYCKIGVSLYSTSIIERWNNNLPGYMLVNDTILEDVISIDSIGPYKGFITTNLDFLHAS